MPFTTIPKGRLCTGTKDTEKYKGIQFYFRTKVPDRKAIFVRVFKLPKQKLKIELLTAAALLSLCRRFIQQGLDMGL